MIKVLTAKALWSLTAFCFTGYTLQALCHGSTFSPVTSPLGDNVYITDTPTSFKLNVTLAGCATQCRFYSALNGGSSECRCFNYNSSNTNCSVFAFPPTTVNVTNLNGFPTAYQTSDGPVTALFPTVNRRQCLIPFQHNGQNSYDCLHNNRANFKGQFGCVLPNGKQAFCNPHSDRGLYMAHSITSQDSRSVTAVAQSSDKLFVARAGFAGAGSQLSVYDTATTTFELLPQSYSSSSGYFSGLAVDPTNGLLYLADVDYSNSDTTIHVLDTATLVESSSWSVDLTTSALSVNSAHNILMSDSQWSVYEYTSTGALVRQTQAVPNVLVYSVYQAAEASIGTWVVSVPGLNDVILITVSGTLLRSYGVGRVNAPTSLAVDKHGFVLVADYGNNRILALDPTLAKSSNVTLPLDTADQLRNPNGLWFDESRGRLYVGEGDGQRRVLVFDNLLSISDVLSLQP